MNLQNPKFVLIAIAVLFFAPLLLAIMMRASWWGFEPSSFANLGILIQPPVEFPVTALERLSSGSEKAVTQTKQWIVLYTFDKECLEPCQADVAGLRQIHIAAGRKRSKVAIWLLTPERVTEETHKKLINIYPEFNILIDTDDEAMRVLNSVIGRTGISESSWSDGQAFLLDPATNIILRYKPGFDPNDINRDLDRLMTWSVKE